MPAVPPSPHSWRRSRRSAPPSAPWYPPWRRGPSVGTSWHTGQRRRPPPGRRKTALGSSCRRTVPPAAVRKQTRMRRAAAPPHCRGTPAPLSHLPMAYSPSPVFPVPVPSLPTAWLQAQAVPPALPEQVPSDCPMSRHRQYRPAAACSFSDNPARRISCFSRRSRPPSADSRACLARFAAAAPRRPASRMPPFYMWMPFVPSFLLMWSCAMRTAPRCRWRRSPILRFPARAAAAQPPQ